jgi:hypothetical protein
MTSFSSDFAVSGPFVGGGASLDASFVAHWPPEAGCIGLSLSGTTTSSGSVSTVVATVTLAARELMARSLIDGTSFRITHYALGSSGYDPSNPLVATAVDPNASALESEIYRDTIDLVETATLDGTAKSFVARVGRTDLEAGIGEVALVATILSSPFVSEVGTQFLFALAHRPLQVKTDRDVVSYRIVVAL